MPLSGSIPPPLEKRMTATRVQRSYGDELAQAAVLVIDDEPGMRNFLSKILIEHCANVDVTADTREASRLLDNPKTPKPHECYEKLLNQK